MRSCPDVARFEWCSCAILIPSGGSCVGFVAFVTRRIPGDMLEPLVDELRRYRLVEDE